VEGVIIAVPRDRSKVAVQEAIEAKIPRVWILNGSETDEAVALAEANDIPVIDGVCLLLYSEPLEWICALHRRLAKLSRSYAK